MGAFVVHNPAAGRRTSSAALRRLLDERWPGCELVVSPAPGGLGGLVRSAAEAGRDPILVAGGDGSVAEAVNALGDDPGRVRLGVLPLGTGNDFARSLGIPLGPGRAIEALRRGEARRVDAARLGLPDASEGPTPTAPRWFVNVALTGLAGRVARRVARSRSRPRRPWAYRLAALAELPRSRPVATDLRWDGPTGPERVHRETLAIAIANGAFAGGGLRLAPSARPDDGWLDLVVLPPCRPLELAAVALRTLAGLDDRGRLLRHRARRVWLSVAGPAWLNADGEPLSGRRAAIEVVPGALRLLLPRGSGPAEGGEPGAF